MCVSVCERERVCVCLCVRERESVCVSVCVCVCLPPSLRKTCTFQYCEVNLQFGG